MSHERNIQIPLSELIDKLSILQIKELVFNNDSYAGFMKDVENDIDISLSNFDVKSYAEIIRNIILITIANWEVWFLKDKMQLEIKDEGKYIEDLRLAQDLNNCVKNTIKNKILDLTKDLNEATKRTTFIDKREDQWFVPLLK